MKLNKYIDHTLLKPEATQEQIDKLLNEARQYDFASVCVNPIWVKYAVENLKGSTVNTCTVIGFPLGSTTSAVKAFEAQEAIKNGANEIDMVVNIGAIKEGDWKKVESDIAAVNAVKNGRILKVILETCLLTDEEKVMACKAAVQAGADFVKTSTGFSTGGATVSDVTLMRRTVGSILGVKASGGIHNREEAETMIEAGASRLGCSAGVAIMENKSTVSDY